VLATLEAIPTPVATREEVHQGLLEAGFSPALGAWMTTNLRATDDGFVWRFDLEAVEALITDYFDLDLWPAIRAWPSHTHLNLLAAGQGGRWTSLDRTLAKAAAASGGVRFFTLPESGHWVHVDAPDALAGLLVADLAEIESKMAS